MMILTVETALCSFPLGDVALRSRGWGLEGVAELFGGHPVFVIRPDSGQEAHALFNTPLNGIPTDEPSTRHWDDELTSETQAEERFLGWSGFDASSPVLPVAKSARNPFTGVITLGRAENNDIRLGSPCVSKLHAFIRMTPNGWTVQDANSSNGVFVNHIRVAPNVEHALRPGDELRLADITGTFLDAERLQALCQINSF